MAVTVKTLDEKELEGILNREIKQYPELRIGRIESRPISWAGGYTGLKATIRKRGILGRDVVSLNTHDPASPGYITGEVRILNEKYFQLGQILIGSLTEATGVIYGLPLGVVKKK